MSHTVRIGEAAHETLKELALTDGLSLQAELDRAVELYRRQRLLEETNAAFAALRADPQAWQEELDERQEWEATLSDGLDEP
jgi:hypothetical protein